jgi:deaminated glutathione amidase
MTLRVACVQLRSGEDVGENIRAASALIREAARGGAQFIATPENTTLMAADGGARLAASFDEAHDPAIPVFAALAKELGVHLLIGSLATVVAGAQGTNKTANRSYLFAPDGTVTARYSKIHLFDVDLSGGEHYAESATVAAGDRAVLAQTPWGKLGLTICYDVRFPHLYRTLAQAGAFAFAVPAAFTVPTGEAHWHVLLRARAIENGAFVFAPAQGGSHANGRKTYGHSLIVGPWGEVLAEAGIDPGVIFADIDPAQSAAVRARLPSLRHDRDWSV